MKIQLKQNFSFGSLELLDKLNDSNFAIDLFLFNLAKTCNDCEIDLKNHDQVQAYLKKLYPSDGLEEKKVQSLFAKYADLSLYLHAIALGQTHVNNAMSALEKNDVSRFLSLILEFPKKMVSVGTSSQFPADTILPLTITTFLLVIETHPEQQIKKLFEVFHYLQKNICNGHHIISNYGLYGGVDERAYLFNNICLALGYIKNNLLPPEDNGELGYALIIKCDYTLITMALDHLLEQRGIERFCDSLKDLILSLKDKSSSKNKPYLDAIYHQLYTLIDTKRNLEIAAHKWKDICLSLRYIDEFENKKIDAIQSGLSLDGELSFPEVFNPFEQERFCKQRLEQLLQKIKFNLKLSDGETSVLFPTGFLSFENISRLSQYNILNKLNPILIAAKDYITSQEAIAGMSKIHCENIVLCLRKAAKEIKELRSDNPYLKNIEEAFTQSSVACCQIEEIMCSPQFNMLKL